MMLMMLMCTVLLWRHCCWALAMQQSIDISCPLELAAEPVEPGSPRPAHFLALVGRPYLWPAHFFG